MHVDAHVLVVVRVDGQPPPDNDFEVSGVRIIQFWDKATPRHWRADDATLAKKKECEDDANLGEIEDNDKARAWCVGYCADWAVKAERGKCGNACVRSELAGTRDRFSWDACARRSARASRAVDPRGLALTPGSVALRIAHRVWVLEAP